MAIEKYFENPDVIFDPVPSYVGIWLFGTNNLVKNSKKENGENLFQKYYQNNVTDKLKGYFKYWDYLRFPVGFMSAANDNMIGRRLSISKIDFFVGITQFLTSNVDKYGMSEEEYNDYIQELTTNIQKDNETLNNIYADALKRKAERLKTLLDDEFNSPYFDVANKDYGDYKLVRGDKVNFTKYIESTYELTISLEKGLRILGDFLDNNLDSKLMFDCFDPDQFYLLFAVIIYEYNLMVEKEGGSLDSTYNYLYNYFETIKKVIQDDPKYNPTILYEWKDGKKEKLSRRNLEQKYNELLERHPEVKPVTLPDFEDSEKYKDINLMEKLRSIYEGGTELNWEFLPSGQKIKTSDDIETKNSNNESVNKEELKEKSIEETNIRVKVLEKSGYIGRPIRGLNSFSGYYAFVYPNGKVILEKFWDDEDKLEPSIHNATYVMSIDNFIEMSKISKLDLIEYMKLFPEEGMKRFYHSSIETWQKNIFNEINGTNRVEEVLDFFKKLQKEK